jgi:hypothetical protein
MEKEKEVPRSEIHYRLLSITKTKEGSVITGNCGGYSFEVHDTKKGEVYWFFSEAPEDKNASESVTQALREVAQFVVNEPDDFISCYCGVCEELRASPIKVYLATVTFPSGVSMDFSFLTIGNSAKDFKQAVKKALRHAIRKAVGIHDAGARFIRNMSRLSFAATRHYSLEEIEIMLDTDEDEKVTARIRVAKE